MSAQLKPTRNSSSSINLEDITKNPGFVPTFGYVKKNDGKSLPRPANYISTNTTGMKYTDENVKPKPTAPPLNEMTPVDKWWEKLPTPGPPTEEESTFYVPTEQYYNDDAKYLKEYENATEQENDDELFPTEGGGKQTRIRKTHKRRISRKRKTHKRRTTRRRKVLKSRK